MKIRKADLKPEFLGYHPCPGRTDIGLFIIRYGIIANYIPLFSKEFALRTLIGLRAGTIQVSPELFDQASRAVALSSLPDDILSDDAAVRLKKEMQEPELAAKIKQLVDRINRPPKQQGSVH